MKRRNFLKGMLAAPFAAKAVAESNVPPAITPEKAEAAGIFNPITDDTLISHDLNFPHVYASAEPYPIQVEDWATQVSAEVTHVTAETIKGTKHAK